MIRVAIFLVVLGLIALGVHWVAERPGTVSVTWLGWRIETSLLVMKAALLLVIAAAIFAWSLLVMLWRAPRRTGESMQRRRDERGQRAIERGLIAVGAGDTRAAQRYADDVRKLASDEPLALLLSAQAAQLTGDRAAAERAFREMAAHEPTKLLGLRGLFIEAQRRDDLVKARLYAEEAAKIAPSLPWAGQAVLQIRCASGDFAGALDMLERNRASGALDRDSFKRQRAVLLTARAISLEDNERDTAKASVFEAVKLAPDLVPAVALAARFLAENGELRKATKMIERAWQVSPHPDLAETYVYLRFGDSALDRLNRARKLASLVPNNIESALALARAAINAREFAEARRAMAPYLAQPSQRVALLMADLEHSDSANEGRAREWTARAVHAQRDPAWTADGYVSDRWLPISPVSGRIDAFEWKAPVAEIATAQPVPEADIEETSTRPVIDAKPVTEPAPKPAAKPEPQPVSEAEVASPPEPVRPAAPVRESKPRPTPVAETIVPLAHVPDDPGPEGEHEPDPVPDGRSAASPGWKRLFS